MTNFPFERAHRLAVQYAGISKPLGDTTFSWKPRELLAGILLSEK